MAVELIHRIVEIVLVERFLGIQSAGRCQPRAASSVTQKQLGAGEEQPAVDDGLEQTPLTGRADGHKESVELKTCPGVVEDRQTAVIEGLVELDLTGGPEERDLA